MDVKSAIAARRTIRKFKNTPVDSEKLTELIQAAVLAPTGANLQPLKYKIITDKDIRFKLFPNIKYAGAIPNWNPTFEQTPTAFIAVLADTLIKPSANTECDCGAAIMSMCLYAVEMGLGTCWLGAINRKEIKKILRLDEKFEVKYLLGIGESDQQGEIFPINDTVKYYFDENENCHVPKRTLAEVIV